MVVYFSGTGNSRWCANRIAQALDDECLDSFPLLRKGLPAALTSHRPWVFVAPTYGWQIPTVFADFLRSGHFSGNQNAYFVMTCGGEIGNAGASLADICDDQGLLYRGVLQVVMPENYVALFGAPQEDEARQIIREAKPVLDVGARCIQEDRDFPAHPTSLLDKLRSGPIHAGFTRFLVRDRLFTVTDACTGCGQCARGCVTNNISLTEPDKTPQWGGRCIHCMACLCTCPAQAIEYGAASRGKPRYQCPTDV